MNKPVLNFDDYVQMYGQKPKKDDHASWHFIGTKAGVGAIYAYDMPWKNAQEKIEAEGKPGLEYRVLRSDSYRNRRGQQTQKPKKQVMHD